MLRSARWVPARSAVLGMVLVVVLVGLIFGIRVAYSRASAAGLVLASGPPSGTSAGTEPLPSSAAQGVHRGNSSASPAPTSAGVSGGPSGQIAVHVIGAVHHPGLVTVSAGSRVADAISAAGGASVDADLSRLNVARQLVDGEQIRVLTPGETPLPNPDVGSSGAMIPQGRPGQPLALNTADLNALDALPGVGPVLAQRIIDWREAHGRFTHVDELGEVTGIGEKLLAQITPLVTV